MDGYTTLIPTNLYTPVGVVTSIVGFVLTLVFFMYQNPHVDTNSPIRRMRDQSI